MKLQQKGRPYTYERAGHKFVSTRELNAAPYDVPDSCETRGSRRPRRKLPHGFPRDSIAGGRAV